MVDLSCNFLNNLRIFIGEVENVVTDSISNFDYLNSISQHTSPNDLLFEVTDLPGFGARLYYVERRSTLEESNIEEKPIKQQLKFGTDVIFFIFALFLLIIILKIVYRF